MEAQMSNRSFWIKDLKDKKGKVIHFHAQFLTYLIWTAPERGMTASELRRTFRRVCAAWSLEPDWKTTFRFSWYLMTSGYVSAYWLRPGFYLNDMLMELRQRCVFREGLRDTPFDKMERIRKRYETPGVPYRRQDRITCDVEALIRYINAEDEIKTEAAFKRA